MKRVYVAGKRKESRRLKKIIASDRDFKVIYDSH